MYMTKQKFDEIKKRYSAFLILDTDVNNALSFVQELLEAEASALRKKCAYAYRSIADMETASRQA